MPANYVTKIRKLQWNQLRGMWSKIASGTKIYGWNSGKALEHLVLRGFELDGAKVTWPFDVQIDGDVIEQIDGVVYVRHIPCLIECKHTTDRVNVEPLAKLRNQLLRRHSNAVGSIFSVNGFTAPAETLAQFMAPQAIMLWNGYELQEMLKSEKFVDPFMTKYEYLIEQGIADFDTRAASVP